jgi:adenylate kinase family enzyme
VDPHRITIIGASGVGKTTLGRALATHLGIPHFDSDDYYHLPSDPPYRTQRTPEDRCALIERDLAPFESWILAGGAGTWDPAPALDYTLQILVSLPCELRIRRLLERESALYGERVLPGGDMESDHRAFMEWTAGYDDSTSEGTNTLACHEAFLRRAACPVLRLTGPMSEEDAIARVLAQLRAR